MVKYQKGGDTCICMADSFCCTVETNTYQPGEFPFQYPIILPFHIVHGVLKGRILKWFAIPLVDHVLSEFSSMTCPSWVAPHGMADSFTELDKAVFHVVRLASFL